MASDTDTNSDPIPSSYQYQYESMSKAYQQLQQDAQNQFNSLLQQSTLKENELHHHYQNKINALQHQLDTLQHQSKASEIRYESDLHTLYTKMQLLQQQSHLINTPPTFTTTTISTQTTTPSYEVLQNTNQALSQQIRHLLKQATVPTSMPSQLVYFCTIDELQQQNNNLVQTLFKMQELMPTHKEAMLVDHETQTMHATVSSAMQTDTVYTPQQMTHYQDQIDALHKEIALKNKLIDWQQESGIVNRKKQLVDLKVKYRTLQEDHAQLQEQIETIEKQQMGIVAEKEGLYERLSVNNDALEQLKWQHTDLQQRHAVILRELQEKPPVVGQVNQLDIHMALLESNQLLRGKRKPVLEQSVQAGQYCVSKAVQKDDMAYKDLKRRYDMLYEMVQQEEIAALEVTRPEKPVAPAEPVVPEKAPESPKQVPVEPPVEAPEVPEEVPKEITKETLKETTKETKQATPPSSPDVETPVEAPVEAPVEEAVDDKPSPAKEPLKKPKKRSAEPYEPPQKRKAKNDSNSLLEKLKKTKGEKKSRIKRITFDNKQ